MSRDATLQYRGGGRSPRALVAWFKRRRTLDVGAIFDAEYEFVWRTLRRLGVPSRAADDGVQEVFVVMHRRAADYEADRPIRPLLYGIARRVASRLRAQESRVQGDSGAYAALGDDAPLPDAVAQRREAAAMVAVFLESLEPTQREAFLLIEVEGMTSRQAAAVLRINVNTVTSRVRLARKKYRRRLAQWRAREERADVQR